MDLELRYKDKIISKEFHQELNVVLDEMRLSAKICLEVVFIAIIGMLVATIMFPNGVRYLIYLVDTIIALIFLGGACGFYRKCCYYRKIEDEYIKFVEDKNEITVL